MGFTEADDKKPISEFSGGQRTKIAFIKILLTKPDILLLDEPTNHLDIETIQWLESYLRSYKSTLVIISHDRMFLNRIVDKVY
ncbi:ATP-binding cassette domain-containing protein, partial [Escherichia coli]